MRRTHQEKRGEGLHVRGGASASVEIEVERLRRRFERFRRSHEPGTRIPNVLRAAALTALERGASEGDVRRACQATSVQLTRWRAQQKQGPQVSGPAEPFARVYNVVDERAELDTGLSGETSSPELELRLGGWAVRISQLGG